jgi:hypothetical protein
VESEGAIFHHISYAQILLVSHVAVIRMIYDEANEAIHISAEV